MIHLICLGNPLHADDGFGAAMAHRLAAMTWPETVRILDGTARISPVTLFENCHHAVVIESLPRRLGTPGEILRLDGAGYRGHPPDQFNGGTAAVLAAVRRQPSGGPSVEVMGPVVASRLPFAPGLTPLVMAAAHSLTVRLAQEFGGVRPPMRKRLRA